MSSFCEGFQAQHTFVSLCKICGNDLELDFFKSRKNQLADVNLVINQIYFEAFISPITGPFSVIPMIRAKHWCCRECLFVSITEKSSFVVGSLKLFSVLALYLIMSVIALNVKLLNVTKTACDKIFHLKQINFCYCKSALWYFLCNQEHVHKNLEQSCYIREACRIT